MACEMFTIRDAPQCRDYTVLTEPNRQQSFGYGSNSDNRLVPGWYRFQSSSYSRIVDNCIPIRKCSSDLTGWLNGEHPTFEDCIVRSEVCFHGLLNYCYRTVKIRVRECQGYYVYELNPSPTERFSRYCASGRTLSSALSTSQDSINGQHALVKKTVS
ncbi:unnamed protein product [Porites lobata]|uniref:UMOD/GP2/OIT3-like D8C domain-containing protein n=1 Tax=Porites lobata TaxID=104759 RepID=A0ABN8QKT6_9CNID|nr:unnamed protein product [Porites lobata]